MVRFIIILVVSLLLTGCGAGGVGARLDDNKINTIFTAKDDREDYATVFVYREARAATAYGVMRVLIDDVKVLELGNGSYTKIYIKPGKHKIRLKFYEDDYMSQDVTADKEITPGKPWLLMSDYFGETKKLVQQDFVALKALLREQLFQETGQQIVSTLTVTKEDHELWAEFANKNSVKAMDNFLYLYPNSPYARDAKNRKQLLINNEVTELDKARKQPGVRPLVDFADKYPQAHNKQAALGEAIKRSRGANDMMMLSRKFPESVSLMPDKYKMEFELMSIGPEDMKIGYVVDLLQTEKLPAGIVAAKVMASAGLYKDFSSAEIRFLQSRGIPFPVIESMINSDTRAREEIKRAEKDQALMQQIREVMEKSQQQVGAQAVKIDGGNSTIECIKQQTALEACNRTTSGFFKMACDATARSSFSCTSF